MDLSIIIPSYKSGLTLQKNLSGFIKYLDSLSIIYEIIVVDDGSLDSGLTKSIAESLQCKYFENPKNMGKGAAIKLGMQNASGKYRIFTDADIPYDYDAIKTMLHYLNEKEFDMVVADRKLQRSVYYEDMPATRNVVSGVFSWLVGLFIVGGWYDTQAGLKGFKSNVADELFSLSRINGFTMDVELFYLALKKNYDIKRISVKLRSKDGTSIRVLKHGLIMGTELLRIIFYRMRGGYKRKG